jgi:hypothetical protein
VHLWNDAALQGIRDSKLGSPIASRALAIIDTCMYDAWAAYDEHAIGTQLGGALRRPPSEMTVVNKEKAISYAAYRALMDLLPADKDSVYVPLMRNLGYTPENESTDIETPIGIANVSCAAVLEFRHHDKANQLGDLARGAYSDWSGYRPVNSPGTVPAHALLTKPLNPEHWQPLTYTDSSGNLAMQMFAGAQWCYVTPFAMSKGDDLRSLVEPGPLKFTSPEYLKQAQELVDISGNLTDREKMLSEYWSEDPNSEQASERWASFARFVSARDHRILDDDVKVFFLLSNAMLDAEIATWDAKRAYDSVRPVTAIPLLFRGKKIKAWGGPGKGTVEMDGSRWIPYQPSSFPTPPSPEYVSSESTISAAAAHILELWTGSDRFDYSVTLPAGSSKIEPGRTPASTLVLHWDKFSDASDEAGLSQRFGGTRFQRADLAGRLLGRSVASKVWERATGLFKGTLVPIQRR